MLPVWANIALIITLPILTGLLAYWCKDEPNGHFWEGVTYTLALIIASGLTVWFTYIR